MSGLGGESRAGRPTFLAESRLGYGASEDSRCRNTKPVPLKLDMLLTKDSGWERARVVRGWIKLSSKIRLEVTVGGWLGWVLML